MSCTKALTFSIKEDDTPLDSAIYVSSVNKIFGCRGQWLYTFNATTGRKESEQTVFSDALGHTSICEYNGKLYMGIYWTQTPKNPNTWRNHDVLEINPATLAVTNTLLWKTNRASFDQEHSIFGPVQMVAGTTVLWGIVASPTMFAPFTCDPTNAASLTYTDVSLLSFHAGPLSAEMIFDSTLGYAVWADAIGRQIQQWDPAGLVEIGRMGGAFTKRPVGICYCPSQLTYYAVDGSAVVITVLAATMAGLAGVAGSVNTGEATCNARRIKYCAIDGFIYVPGWASNSVIVINPATNTVVATKTGFNQPWDCVFTGSKKFAVQNSSVPLKEIT